MTLCRPLPPPRPLSVTNITNSPNQMSMSKLPLGLQMYTLPDDVDLEMIFKHVVLTAGVAPGEAGERDGDLRVSRPRPSRTFTSGFELEERLERNSKLRTDPGIKSINYFSAEKS